MSSKKGKERKLLLRGVYYNVPSPWGAVKANCEVWLHVKVWVDTDGQDHGERGSCKGRDDGSDVFGGNGEIESVLQGIAQRLGDIIETSTPPAPTLERIAQVELFEGLEGRTS